MSKDVYTFSLVRNAVNCVYYRGTLNKESMMAWFYIAVLYIGKCYSVPIWGRQSNNVQQTCKYNT